MKKCLIAALVLLIPGLRAADIEIHRVIPSKIIYAPGETGSVKLTVANTTDTPQTAVAKFFTVWDLDSERSIGELEVTLSPQEVKTLVLPWKTGQETYGRSIRAEVWRGKEKLAQRSEFFNVTAQWWRVNQILGYGYWSDFGQEGRRRLMEYYHLPFKTYKFSRIGKDPAVEEIGPFMTYGNHSMLFASMPSAFGDQTPDLADDVVWYSGSGRYKFTNQIFKDKVKWARKWGTKLSMFTIDSLTGPAGFEIGRRHPEFIARDKHGAYVDRWYQPPSPIELAKDITVRMNGWYGLSPDFYNPDCVRFGADELAAGLRQFNWDGYYFDGLSTVYPHYSWDGSKRPAKGEDQETISARNMKTVRDVIRKEFPDTFLWYTSVNPAKFGQFEPSGNHGGLKARLEMLSDPKSGRLWEHQAAQIIDPNYFSHNWRCLYEAYLDQRNATRQEKNDFGRKLSSIVVSGSLNYTFFYTKMGENGKAKFMKTRDQWAWANHAASLMAASQMHLFGGGHSFRPIAQLMTRYSKFFWSDDLRIMDKTYRQFAVDTLREIWWEEAVYARETPTYTETIFNLINSPDEEKPHVNICHDPEIADDVEISLLNATSAEKIRAWAICPYGYEDPIKEPRCIEIKPKIVDREVVLEVPAFTYYSLVVVRKYKTTK
jgi:hypothetical protein